jgi:NADPH-dependent glutamate synthase beta subunit-like oxidoreductase
MEVDGSGRSSAGPHLVVVGGGFGGLYAARAAARYPVRITIVDRENHYLFQPLLYQVATGVLSPDDIAEPIRSILRKYVNVRVRLGEVITVDPDRRDLLLVDGSHLTFDYPGTRRSPRSHDTRWHANSTRWIRPGPRSIVGGQSAHFAQLSVRPLGQRRAPVACTWSRGSCQRSSARG